jgi:NAD(P)-dependent dehydrogenase (short-subunit alcohol dehydrogenase family)
MSHPAITTDGVAVVTGGASGIGLAAARAFADRGMTVVVADLPGPALSQATANLGECVHTVPTDVSKLEDLERLKAFAYGLGDVTILMNNAGVGGGGKPWLNRDGWQRVLGVNLWGVINGVQTFVPEMLARGRPGAVINTGSKQGITNPPGDAAYNVSKAGVKTLTEQLAHELRNVAGAKITAHLLVPGYTFTGLTAHGATQKPAAAWTPEQVVARLLAGLEQDTFYILCEDNETSRALDERRMQWAADDMIRNRPALSRWHLDYAEAFKAFLK